MTPIVPGSGSPRHALPWVDVLDPRHRDAVRELQRLAVRGQRRAMESSPQIEAIRKRARGAVDVRYVGRIVKQGVPWDQRRNRLLWIGGSIGHYNITAGTRGRFVKSRKGGVTLILSNNHVLADENRGKPGDAILQPGVDDGGRPRVEGRRRPTRPRAASRG